MGPSYCPLLQLLAGISDAVLVLVAYCVLHQAALIRVAALPSQRPRGQALLPSEVGGEAWKHTELVISRAYHRGLWARFRRGLF